MDIYDMRVEGPKTDILRNMVQAGQKVRLTRMVTITYELTETDITEIMEDSGETSISLEALIKGEEDAVDIWELEGKCHVEDDVVISVEIL